MSSKTDASSAAVAAAVTAAAAEPLSDNTLTIYLSHTRNTYTLTSLGIATITFGKYFDIDDSDTYIPLVVRATGCVLFVMSVVYGIMAGADFDVYLRQQKEDTPPDASPLRRIQLERWPKWIAVNYTFLAIVTVVALFVSLTKIRRTVVQK